MSELEAGRETDALVHEFVLGVALTEAEREAVNNPPGRFDERDPFWWLPEYTTNFDAAFGVARRMSPGRLLGLSEFYVGGDPNKRAWRAIFSSTNGKAPLHVKAEADTPALAISRAALMCCAPTLEKQPLAVEGES